MGKDRILSSTEKTFLSWYKNPEYKIREKSAVKHRILNFDMTSLKGKYVTVKRAKVLCKDQTLAEIEAVSAGAAVFFSWCMVTIDAFEMLT